MEKTEKIYIDRIAEEATRRGIENISQYLFYAYTIGYERGWKDRLNKRKKLENSTPIVRIDSIGGKTIFPTVISAARSTGVTHPTILRVIRNKKKLKGFTFKKL